MLHSAGDPLNCLLLPSPFEMTFLSVAPALQVCARLGVHRGSRYVHATGEKRPYAIEQAILRRAVFDEASEVVGEGKLKIGDKASSRGRPCTVVEIDYKEDTCKLSFDYAGVHVTRDYHCIYKAAGSKRFPKGSARLRSVVTSLRPGSREQRSDAKAEAARPLVEEFFDLEGARSPSQRDSVRRRVGVGLYQTAQALYVYAKYSALYAKYLIMHPANRISFSMFKSLRPWYIRRAKQETCLCKHCENFKGFQDALNSVAQVRTSSYLASMQPRARTFACPCTQSRCLALRVGCSCLKSWLIRQERQRGSTLTMKMTTSLRSARGRVRQVFSSCSVSAN